MDFTSNKYHYVAKKIGPLENRIIRVPLYIITSCFTRRSKENNFAVIFIHPLECGLFRIFIEGQNAFKGGIATTLVSGTVVSRRALGKLYINYCNYFDNKMKF